MFSCMCRNVLPAYSSAKIVQKSMSFSTAMITQESLANAKGNTPQNCGILDDHFLDNYSGGLSLRCLCFMTF